MASLREVLESWADSKTVSGSEKRINQNDRNNMKREVKEAFMEIAIREIGDSSTVAVFENEKGIAFRLDNERIGYITLTIDPMVKDLDYDADEEAEAFSEKQQAKAQKIAERNRLKELKMQQDAELRAKKDELKRLKAEKRAIGGLNHGN